MRARARSQAPGDVGHFLAHRRRRRRLAVRAAHHRHVGVGVRQFDQPGDDLVQRRQHGLFAGALAHQRVRQVVDVFGGAGEVDEFADLDDLGVAPGVLLDPVFERLDVVVGDGFLGLDLGRLLDAEIGDQRIELGLRSTAKKGQFR
jgi:hypothetical protein